MIIEKLELKGFQRMFYGEKMIFEITFTQPFQQILGSNGSGKSSLLEELSPLPANAAHYFPDGSKTIWLNDQKHKYVLKTIFSPKTKHSFIKDGEELNETGVVSEQLKLIYEHFKLTPKIHQLQLGLKNALFTKMKGPERKDWMTLLNNVSYDYIIGVYNKAKKRHRDAVGTVNNLKRRLVSETTKLIDEKDAKRIANEVKRLHEELTVFIGNVSPNIDPLETIKSRLERLLGDMDDLYRKTVSIHYRGRYALSYANISAIEGERVKLTTEIENLTQEIQRLTQQHKELLDKAAVLKEAGEKGLNSVDAKIKEISDRLNELTLNLFFRHVFKNSKESERILDRIEPELLSIVSSIPNNEQYYFSKASLISLTEERDKLFNEIRRGESYLEKQRAALEHLEQHKRDGEVQCPACAHKWIPGYSVDKVSILQKNIETYSTGVEDRKIHLKKFEEKIAEIESYFRLYKAFLDIANHTPVFKPLWDLIEQEETLRLNPSHITNLLVRLRNDLISCNDINRLNDDLANLSAIRAKAVALDSNDHQHIHSRIEEIEQQINTRTGQLTERKLFLNDTNSRLRLAQELLKLKELSEKKFDEIGQLQVHAIAAIRNEVTQEFIRKIQSELAVKEDILNQINLQKNLIYDIESQIEEQLKYQEAFDVLLKELSPTEGLIAEGMLGFIRIFVRKMNRLIKKNWTFRLEILDCGMTDGTTTELDYKFPLLSSVNGSNAKPVDDISDGSRGMQDIINFAFVAIASEYLGIQDQPFYLDEFASSFDDAHKHKATQLVGNLLDFYPFTQLFMISHDFSIHSGISNVEICVLNQDNIQIPTHAEVNKHVRITPY